MTETASLLIRNATVIDPSQGLNQPMDVLIRDGRIAALGQALPDDGTPVLDASGLCCAPGLVDLHVHLRDPGQTHKEDVHTGTAAAAAGGVTSVVCMPNTVPTVDCPAVLSELMNRAQTASARVYPVAAITAGLNGETLTDFAALKAVGAVAVSDDGKPVPTEAMMAEALTRAAQVGLPVLSHSEDRELAGDGIIHSRVAEKLGVPGISSESEWRAVAREIRAAETTGHPVHICHISTAESVAVLREAQARGVHVTAETGPHYFSLTDELTETGDADYRMNPPLRTEADRLAVIEGLRDGTLSVIATDHAPHTAEEKADFRHAPNGVVGLETSLAVGLTYLVKPGVLTLSQLIAAMSTTPAALLGLPAGTLAVGANADVVLFDPEQTWTVQPEQLHSRSKNTPFKGMTLTGRVQYTLLGGKIVYTAG